MRFPRRHQRARDWTARLWRAHHGTGREHRGFSNPHRRPACCRQSRVPFDPTHYPRTMTTDQSAASVIRVTCAPTCDDADFDRLMAGTAVEIDGTLLTIRDAS